MKKEIEMSVDDILSGYHGYACMGKSEAIAALAVEAWKAKQRGETHIKLVISTEMTDPNWESHLYSQSGESSQDY